MRVGLLVGVAILGGESMLAAIVKTTLRQIFSTQPTPAIAPELLIGALALIGLGILPLINFAFGQDKEKEDKGEEEKDKNLVYANDFEADEPGRVPGDYFVLDGGFEIEKGEVEGAGQALKMLPAPMVEGSIQFGSSLEGGGSVKMRAKAEKRGRSYPRFGVGMHGLKGYRLRVAPSAKQLQLVRDEEVIQSVPFDWTSGLWYFVELQVLENNNSWTVSGRVWSESVERPKDAQIDYIAVETEFRGKASILGTPYAGLPIWFDDLEIRRVGEPEAKPQPE